MLRTKIYGVALSLLFVLLTACGQKDEGKSQAEKSKVEEAVKQAVTKEFKMYEGAKAALEKVDKEAKERLEKEAK